MNHTPLGLFRHLSFEERQKVQNEIELSFVDLYDTLESARFEVNELEKSLDHILKGERCE